MDVSNLSGKTVLVTGAGSGIGRESALEFGRRGASLVICDVNETGLADTDRQLQGMGRTVFAQKVDVADREAMRTFADVVHQRIEALDILMNNAGVGLGAGFLDTSLADWDWILGINLLGVVHGCHFFIPPMVRRRRGGHVINVASAAAFSATELLSAYSTTKFAVLGLSEALRDELNRHGIGVTAVCPGLINTPITRSSVLRGANATDAARQRMVEVYERRNYGPERVARNIMKAVQRNRAVAPISPEAWFIYYLKRLFPAAIMRINQMMRARFERDIGAAPR